MTCGENQYYTTSMSGCPATCADQSSEDNCPLQRTEGCACNRGYILSGDECVREEECGCILRNGDYLPVNMIIVTIDDIQFLIVRAELNVKQ